MLKVQGEELLQLIEENAVGILDGNMVSDGEGEWTFIGQMENSVVDNALTEVDIREAVRKKKVKKLL